MRELYDYVQYCPNVLSRLYLQICAASALIRSGEVGTRWVLKDIIEAVKCVQNPVRGLFLRHYLLQAIRDKLPNEPILPTEVVPYGMAPPPSISSGTTSTTAQTPGPVIVAEMNEMEKGTVKDSYEFILANFIQMNKLWVRIKHLPGDVRSKDIRRRREKDRNELRILVGTNLVRLSALDAVTSQIYGQVILPSVLDHIIISEDPLAQAYLIDCIVQVFPDEYHIETMPILLAACPKLRDKVNIRTILHSLMERLANYLADEELLDEADSNQVKRQMAQDSFRMMDECVQSVYNARGPKLQAKEVIRLQTALLSFSMKCYRGNLEQITLCLDNCVVALQQARANQALMQESRNVYMDPNAPRVLPQLEEVATKELETLLSIPLEELALGVLTLDHYANLIGFLPWANRRQVALTMLEAVCKAGKSPTSMKEIEELFSVIAPVLREEHENIRGQNTSQMQMTTNLMAGLGVSYQPSFGQADTGMPIQEDPQYRKDAALVSKLIHLLHHQDTDIHFQMLEVARNHLNGGRMQKTGSPFIALVFAGLNLAKRIVLEAVNAEGSGGDGLKDTQIDEGGSKSTAGEAAAEGEHGTESGDKADEGVVAAAEASAIDVTVREADLGTREKSVT
jgi:vacuolar protein sorting-associated protein 35